jgi:glycosyltransferase involved in cell wall biosynthesis
VRYHLVLNHPFDLDKIAQEADADERPRHCMTDAGKLLNATIHLPGQDSISLLDKVYSKLVGRPQDWALARRLVAQLGSEDVVFCIGETVGFAIAALCNPQNAPKLVVFMHNPDRPRAKLAMKLFGLKQRIDLFMTNTVFKAEFLQQYLQLPSDRVSLFREQHTDIRFFTPATPSAPKKRPLIGSGGLESRDYHTLAAAVADLDIDVRASAVSPDAKASLRNMPKVLPSNMVCRYHDWHELRQLYRDSDVVVISLLDHNYQAGLTTLFEAMACRRPVIMTRTPGLVEEVIDGGYIIGVNPGDVDGMKQAIADLLNQPEKAEALAQKGYDFVMQQHNHNVYVQSFADQLTSRYGAPSRSSDVLVEAPVVSRVASAVES